MMFRHKNKRLFCLCLAFLFIVYAGVGHATVQNFTVHPGEEVTNPLDLAVEDHVEIKFTVVGGESGNTLDFWLTSPDGTVKAVYNSVGNINYGFVCEKKDATPCTSPIPHPLKIGW